MGDSLPRNLLEMYTLWLHFRLTESNSRGGHSICFNKSSRLENYCSINQQPTNHGHRLNLASCFCLAYKLKNGFHTGTFAINLMIGNIKFKPQLSKILIIPPNQIVLLIRLKLYLIVPNYHYIFNFIIQIYPMSLDFASQPKVQNIIWPFREKVCRFVLLTRGIIERSNHSSIPNLIRDKNTLLKWNMGLIPYGNFHTVWCQS